MAQRAPVGLGVRKRAGTIDAMRLGRDLSRPLEFGPIPVPSTKLPPVRSACTPKLHPRRNDVQRPRPPASPLSSTQIADRMSAQG